METDSESESGIIFEITVKELLAPLIISQANLRTGSVGGIDPEFLATLDHLVKKIRKKKLKRPVMPATPNVPDKILAMVKGILAVKAAQFVGDRMNG